MSDKNARPIVVGVDDTPESQRALTFAIEEARSRQAPLHIIHAVNIPMPTTYTTVVGAPQADAAVDRARDIIEVAGARAKPRLRPGQVSEHAVQGRAAQTLIEHSKGAELLVVGSRARSAAQAVFLGSVSCAVSAHAQCPVAVVRGGDDGIVPRRIVAGIDGSEHSEDVLRFAFEEARLRNLPLQVVRCWLRSEYNDPEFWTGEKVAAELNRQREHLEDLITACQDGYPGVEATVTIHEGEPKKVLTELSTGATLIVVGSRGHGGVMGALLGSVSQSLLHHAAASVAVVHPRA